MSDRNPLSGRRGVWLQQLSATSEGTFAGVLATMAQYGFSCLCMKVAEGLSWVGAWDPTTPITNVADLVTVKSMCEAAGVTLCPVIVVRGHDVNAEARLAATIATTAGSVMLDIEPYPGYFDHPEQVPAYLAQLRGLTDAFIILEPDPRPGAWSYFQPADVAPYVDAVSGQHYVGSDPNWQSVPVEVARIQDELNTYRELCPTLWAEGDTEVVGEFWDQVKGVCAGFVAFAFGAMNAEQLAALGALPLSSPPDPGPDPDPGPAPAGSEDARLREVLLLRFAALDAGLAQVETGIQQMRAALDPNVIPGEALTSKSAHSRRVEAPGAGSTVKAGESLGKGNHHG